MSSRTTRVVVVAWAGLAWGGCASRAVTTPDDVDISTPIAFPPCDLVSSTVTLELLKVSVDRTPRKPSNLRHLLVDLRIQSQDPRALWLVVNQETFPLTVSDVSKEPEGQWSFSDDGLVNAWWLGPAPDRSIKDIAVTTAARRVPATVATISIGGESPMRWVERGPRAGPAAVEVVCTTWLELPSSSEVSP